MDPADTGLGIRRGGDLRAEDHRRKAGSGLHIHTRLMEGEHNAMVNADGSLSERALKAIAGYLALAPSLTAFGNTNPTSLLPARAPSGGPDEHLLGRPQPLRCWSACRWAGAPEPGAWSATPTRRRSPPR